MLLAPSLLLHHHHAGHHQARASRVSTPWLRSVWASSLQVSSSLLLLLLQFSEAISKAQSLLQDINAFKLVVNVEGQARCAALPTRTCVLHARVRVHVLAPAAHPPVFHADGAVHVHLFVRAHAFRIAHMNSFHMCVYT